MQLTWKLREPAMDSFPSTSRLFSFNRLDSIGSPDWHGARASGPVAMQQWCLLHRAKLQEAERFCPHYWAFCLPTHQSGTPIERNAVSFAPRDICPPGMPLNITNHTTRMLLNCFEVQWSTDIEICPTTGSLVVGYAVAPWNEEKPWDRPSYSTTDSMRLFILGDMLFRCARHTTALVWRWPCPALNEKLWVWLSEIYGLGGICNIWTVVKVSRYLLSAPIWTHWDDAQCWMYRSCCC